MERLKMPKELGWVLVFAFIFSLPPVFGFQGRIPGDFQSPSSPLNQQTKIVPGAGGYQIDTQADTKPEDEDSAGQNAAGTGNSGTGNGTGGTAGASVGQIIGKVISTIVDLLKDLFTGWLLKLLGWLFGG